MAGPVLTIGWATAVATWIAWYLLRQPGVEAPTPVIALITAVALLIGGAIAGAAVGRARTWLAGGLVGLIASGLGLVILLSYLAQPDGAGGVTLERAGFAAAFLGGSVVLGALAGLVGGPFATQAAGRWARGQRDRRFWLSRFAIITGLAFLPLLTAGGTVTSTGAGLAVEGWPGSNGVAMVLFPDAEMDTPRVFYEHAHRLLGMLVGITTIALLAQVLVVESRKLPKILAGALLALVIVQGVMGGLRVTEESMALAIVHGVTGQLVFGLACAIAVVVSPAFFAASASDDPFARRTRIFTTGALHVLILQLTLGALYRHLSTAEDAPSTVNHVLYTHIAFSIIVVIFAVASGFIVRALGQRIQSLRKPLVFVGKALVVVIGLQFVLGWAAWISIMLGDGKGPVVSAAEAGIVPTPPLAQTVLTTAHQANGAVLMGLTAAAFAWGRKLSPKPRKS